MNQLRKRRTGVIVVGIVALIGGLATGRDIFFNITYLVALVLLVSLFWAYNNINWLHLSRVTRTRRTQVGRPLEERFTVKNTGILPKLWVEVRDSSSLPQHHASKVVSNLGSRAGYIWRVSTICSRRGRYRLGPIRLYTSDPFGLFPMHRDLDPTTNIVVYPMTFDIHQFALPIGILPGGDALRRRTHYTTTNAAGVRDYAPGDGYGRIHWPSTARRNRLIVKEFELDPLADIWLVTDMAMFSHIVSEPAEITEDENLEPGQLPAWMRWKDEEYNLPDSTEEYTVSVAASLAQHFIRHDRALGLLAYGQSHEMIQPDRGERQINRILETLAVLRAEGQVAIEDVLDAESQLFPRGTTIIVVTPSNHDTLVSTVRQLSSRGLNIVTILIEPKSFGGFQSSEALATVMRSANLATYLIRCNDDISIALSSQSRRSRYQVVT
jgi:uncharacterized protein (DUF58 family)